MTVSHIHIGQIGEEAVTNHLKRNGYVIHTRNYRKKWGEIDIIAKKRGVIHFVEVKTVSYETKWVDVSRGTWLPEENVDQRKLRKLFRTIETWLLEYKYKDEWQLDIVSVRVDVKNKQGRIKIIENIVRDF
jgi:putative endonuclease